VRKRPPWAPGDPNAEGVSFGTWLRRQREMREIDLHEIAERTKISLRYLQAMEQDRFELLPAPVFARGFLREYAKYVGLSPDEVVNYYLSALGGDEKDDDEGEPAPVRRRGGVASPWSYGVFLVLAVILLAAVIAYLAFYAESRRRDRLPQPLPIAAPPAALAPEAFAAPAPSPPPDEPSAPLQVTLDFTQECWVELVIDGQRRISELHAPGESLQIDAESSVVLANIGNAAGVEVQVNGEPFPLPADGRVVRDVRIELPPEARPGDGAASP
jgi:cytoskeletal protein RodZ